MTNSIIVNPVGFTEYIVTVTDQNSCAQSAIISFETIKPEVSIPNAFTPDGDGLNDVFQIITYNAPVEVLDFKIYNRWGALVHNANGENHGWDGTQDGKPSPSDVYVFRANYVLPDGQNVIQDGELTLLR
jgi:gliding motility-associated-like protein